MVVIIFLSYKIMLTTQIIKIKSSEQRFQNISVKHFKIASEMLIFLMAPIKSNLKKSWLKFSVNLFQTKSPMEIVLTLNRMMKSNIQMDNIADVNQKLFRKVATLFSLKHQEIQSILSSTSRNVSVNGDDQGIENLLNKGIV